MIDKATILYYSDDPEKLSAETQGHTDGVLFDFDLVPGPPQRFLLYHVNIDEQPRTVAIRFFNQTTSNARITYSGCLNPPSEDYMTVGHATTYGFMRALLQGTSKTVQVPPGENIVTEQITLNSQQLGSGIFDCILQVGSKLRVSLVAVADADRIVHAAQMGQTFKLDDFGRRGKFDISDKTPISLECSVDQPKVIARLGQRKLPNLERTPMGIIGGPLKGEYGVFTVINLRLVNSSDKAQNVALYQSAHGGDSTASYVIDGRLVQSVMMPCRDPYRRYKVVKYTVPAHSRVSTSIVTMPDSASNSPVVLAIDRDDPTMADPNCQGSLIAYEPALA